MSKNDALQLNIPTQITSANAFSFFVPESLQKNLGDINSFLSPFLTENRLGRFEEVLQSRSRKVLAVFEETSHCHNVSAVLRSMDALGFQDVLFMYKSGDRNFRMGDSVERGSSQWLLTRRAQDIAKTAKLLKNSGYKIALVSLPSFGITSKYFSQDIPNFPAHSFSSNEFQKFTERENIALIFGAEKYGVSEDWLQFADMYVNIEMYGFVESFNVSVCAAILFYEMRKSVVRNHFLTAQEKMLLREYWISRSLETSTDIMKRQKPEALPYLEFIQGGKFYNPLSVE